MKRRSVSMAVSVVVVLGMVFSLGLVSRQEPLATSRIYLALGDSVAFGTGASDPSTRGYVPVFHDKTLDGLRLANLAVPRETSANFVVAGGQLDKALAVINDPNTDVQVVTLDIGANDLLQLLAPDSPCTPDPVGLDCRLATAGILMTFAVNYTAILEALTAALGSDPGDEVFLLMAYYNPFDGTGSPFESPIDTVLLGADGVMGCGPFGPALGLNDLIACIGGPLGATVVNVHPLFDGKALKLTHIGEGDIHPNDKGHKTVAQAFKKAFK